MKILLTNDDGIYAEGIYTLAKELKKIGTVTIVAPDSEKSSVSHGITLSYPIWCKKIYRNGRFFGYGISGTPADCVKFAIDKLLKHKPDLVISGINLGPNDGCSVIYSGTVAGAREGALLGIPSMAVSLNAYGDPQFPTAAKITVKLVKIVIHNKLPQRTFLNINIPNKKFSKLRGIKFTQQCTTPIHGRFTKRTNPHSLDYYWMSGKMPTKNNNDQIDTYALHQGYITITPIKTDLTDHSFLKQLKMWALK